MQKWVFPGFLWVLMVVFVISCNSPEKTPESEVVVAPEEVPMVSPILMAGLSDSLLLPGTKDQYYTVYIPAGFDFSTVAPLMILLDPHARGKWIVEKYIELADKHQFIIVASRYSRNGLALQNHLAHLRVLLKTALQQLPVDSKRLVLAGFSGGARVATAAGQAQMGFSAVISCAGTFPQGNGSKTVNFPWLTLVGIADFNYVEMWTIDQQRRSQGLPSYLFEFEGKHEWPPLEIMDQAFLWSRLVHHKSGAKSEALMMAKNWEHVKKQSDGLMLAKRELELYAYCRRVNFFFDGLQNTNWHTITLQQLEGTPNILHDQEKAIALANSEPQMQQTYQRFMQQKDANWWGKELQKIDKIIQSTADRQDRNAWSRLKTYIGLMSYIGTSSALDQNAMEQAKILHQRFAQLEPANPDVPFLAAQIAIKEGNNELAIAELQKAGEMGFNQIHALSSPLFDPIRNTESFKAVVKNLP